MRNSRFWVGLTLAGALGASACSVWKEYNGGNGSDRISVDRSLASDGAKLPPFVAGTPERQIGVVVGPTGNRHRLIEEELLVAAKSQADIDGLLARLGGQLLESWNFAAAGDSSGITYHAVHIDSALVAPADLHAALARLDSAAGGIRVSSEAVLATFAAYASESKRGIHVFPNFVLDNDQIPDRTTSEAESAAGEFAGSFTRNAFEWPYMKRGGPLDIGVAEAWRVLEANGRLGTRVPVLILDNGFRQTPDMPVDTVLVGGTRFDVPNPSGCGGGGPCLWHGTGTTRVVAAQVDDSFGGAGTGGPVAQPHLLQSPANNFFDYLRYLGAIAGGLTSARIVNISGSVTIDQWACDLSGFHLGPGGVCHAPHKLGLTLRAAGFLIISSAGNDGARDLDSGDFTMPCEMAGTFCVGGLDWKGPTRFPSSSYASRRDQGAIDLWAPWHVWVGPDPEGDLTLNEATLFTGTSAAAPFVSGVAALVAAADPTLNATQIANVLVSTAHVGGAGRVHRWVNAYGAVAQAVGERIPPFVRIVRPRDGELAPRLPVPTRFDAEVETSGMAPVVSWRSSINGALGTGTTVVSGLSYGIHRITARAQANGVSHSATITIERTNTAPTVEIVAPGSGTRFYANQSIPLLGTSFDPNEEESKLADEQVTWLLGTTTLGSGHALDVPGGTVSPGSYRLRFRGSDGTLSAEMVRDLDILPGPANLLPSIGELTPANGTDLGYTDLEVDELWYKQVTLRASATDPDGPPIIDSAFTWTTTYRHPDTGVILTEELGTGQTLNTKLIGLCGAVQHRVTLTVANGALCGPAEPSCIESKKSVLYTVRLLC
jgi:hypothetical protein